MSIYRERSGQVPKLIGVIHLPPLPGAPGVSNPAQSLARAVALAVNEAKILTQNSFDGIILENFGDAPFFKTQVKAETISAMSVIAAAVRDVTPAKLGINVLRNDAFSALAIAAVTGANFIRVNVLSGVAATDQGLIEGCSAELIRERSRLGVDHIAILADVFVKHARSLSSTNLEIAIEETAGRGGADGIIITGSTTGRSPSSDMLNEALQATHAARVPLYIGSGMTAEGLKDLDPSVRVIVGSALRRGGKAGAALDLKRIKAFSRAWKQR